jgi:hypothetical protein
MKVNERFEIHIDAVVNTMGKVAEVQKYSAEIDDHVEKRIYILDKTFMSESAAEKAALDFITSLEKTS